MNQITKEGNLGKEEKKGKINLKKKITIMQLKKNVRKKDKMKTQAKNKKGNVLSMYLLNDEGTWSNIQRYENAKIDRIYK